MKKIIFLLFSISTLFSCRLHLPEGQNIYRGASFELIKKDSSKSENLNDIKTLLEKSARPEPNTTLFNMPYKVAIKTSLGKNSDKGLKGWVNNTLGENPISFDEIILAKNINNLTQVLKSKGYFNSNVNGKITQKGKFTNAHYIATLNKRFVLDTVIFLKGSSQFEEDFEKSTQNLSFGRYFDLDEIQNARNAIDAKMRQLGYFNFNPDFVAVYADTTQNPKRVKIKIGPKQNLKDNDKKQFQINDIYVDVDAKTTTQKLTGDEDMFRGLILDDPKQKFKNYLFEDAIGFRPGTLFNNNLQQITNNRLLSLGVFKSIKSSFSVVNRIDSTFLDLHYFLQTQKRKSLKLEANGISNSNGLGGTQINLNWANNNVFHGAESFKIVGTLNSEFQFGGKKQALAYTNDVRIGVNAFYSVPRFLAPFIKIDPEVSNVLPKTIFTAGWETFIKTNLYTLNSFKASINYSWTRGKGIEYTFRPLNINYVKAGNYGTALVEYIFQNPSLLYVLEDQLIVGGGFEVNVRQKKLAAGTYTYRGAVDFAGFMFNMLNKIRNNPSKDGTMFGSVYTNYIRFDNDFRYKVKINPKLEWANRAIVGVGVPLKNILFLPYTAQFFVGGNNSLRAFRARGVGPGAYVHDNSIQSAFLGNFMGDIKLETNTELRFKATDLLNLALFVDAGNVWMFKDPSLYGQESLFTKNFYKQLAIGTGLGFRFDFTFIIFRIDLATPVRNPWLSSSPWVIKDVKLLNGPWRSNNIIWNIAIGLPF